MGGNISGTSDLAPLDQQAAMLQELFPTPKNVGLLYCSAEPNSVYQCDVIEGYLTEMVWRPPVRSHRYQRCHLLSPRPLLLPLT